MHAYICTCMLVYVYAHPCLLNEVEEERLPVSDYARGGPGKVLVEAHECCGRYVEIPLLIFLGGSVGKCIYIRIQAFMYTHTYQKVPRS